MTQHLADEPRPAVETIAAQGPVAMPRGRRLSLPAMLVIVAVLAGAALRFYNRDWDEGKMLHPDERFVTVLTGQLEVPDSLGEFFDPSRSTLNPFNTAWGGAYVYGTLPIFVVRAVGEFLDEGCGPEPSLPAKLAARLFVGADVLADCEGDLISRWYSGSVGRTFSALSEVLSLLLLFLLGRRLFGSAIAAVAVVGSAFSAFQIQAAHFYTVDAATNLLVLLALYFCARLITRAGLASPQQQGLARFPPAAAGWRSWLPRARAMSRPVLDHWACDALLAGTACGLATGSKLNAVLLVPVIMVAIMVALLRDHRPGLRPLAHAIAALAIAGASAFLAFRVAQPYAFVGTSEKEWETTLEQCSTLPDDADAFTRLCHLGTQLPAAVRPLLVVSSRWATQLRGIQAYVSGEAEAPFTHQWANRMDYVFPLRNILFWGLGLPLGIAAIAGFFYMLRQLLRADRWWAHLVPVMWVTMGFLSFASVSGKTMRYFLPIYPILALCAAVGLHHLWGVRRWRLDLGRALTVLVMVGTMIWAWAFLAVYRAPVTRITASRWIFEHVPSALTMTWDGGARSINLPIKTIDAAPDQPATVVFRLKHDDLEGEASVNDPSLVLSHVEGAGNAHVGLFEAGRDTPLAETTVAFAPGPVAIAFAGATVHADREYGLVLDEVTAPLSARTNVIATEHWDDAVPTGVDGRDILGWYYASLTSSSDGQIQNYAEDDPSKLELILDWLDEADYISMSSNRLYAAIPRLPWRFPMTTEYYRALIEGDLGFELYADFASFPRLGPFVFNDQELPQRLRYTDATAVRLTGIEVPYPTAEEAFSVYDHPRVLLYRKTASYSRERARELLGRYDLSRVVRQRPIDAVTSPRGLLFDEQTRAAQREGGTWADLFPPDSALNRSQPLAWLAWVALLFAIGLATFPIAFATLRRGGRPVFVDGGYALARILGLLLTAWTVWVLASVKLARFVAPTIWAVYALLGAVGIAIALRMRRELLAFVRARRWLLVASELTFLIAFLFWTWVRVGNPDLWHPAMGGEKPMDFAYLNGVLRSTFFPPVDPWFSGGYINYYYFGFVLVAAPIKALGIAPQVAYNLAVPMLFALTASAAFGIGATARRILSGSGSVEGEAEPGLLSTLAAGAASAVFVVLLGNLGEIAVLWPAWRELGGDGGGVLAGLVKWLGGADLPIRPEWPYWNPTRLTPEVPIAEFPQFTFLYADLHAHMIGMPLALLAFAFTIAFAAGALRWYTLLLGAIAVGAIWPTNTWDYPIYLLLAIGAILLDALSTERYCWRRLGSSALVVGSFALLTRVLFIPYFEHFGNAYGKVGRFEEEATPLWAYLVVWSTFLLPLLAALLYEHGPTVRSLHARLRARGPLAAGAAGWIAIGTAGAAAIAAGVLVARGVPVASIAVPFLVAALAASYKSAAAERRLLWLAIAGACALTLFVELFVLAGDLGRMNTMFKAYVQVWLLLGTMAGPLLVLVLARLRGRSRAARARLDEARAALRPPLPEETHARTRARIARLAFILPMTILVALAALYPLIAIPAKRSDRYVEQAPRGLDGAAYMHLATRLESGEDIAPIDMRLEYDYDTIEWLEHNLQGTPVVLEGTTGGYQYRWGNRISIYSGLPTVIGWEWHQRQQRAAFTDRVVFDRNADVREFYSTTDSERALLLLDRYDVDYVVLGQLERAYYDEAGLDKFEELERAGRLRRVHENPGGAVYEVVRDG